jgi:CBS domain-containing protein
MTLSLILSRKGRDVVTASPHRTLREAVQTLSDKGIGAILVVGPENQLLGIVSERDIVRALAKHDAVILNDAVSRHMTTRIVTATEETGVPDAMEQMTTGRFRHLPVMDGDRVIGLVSIGDLVKHRLSEMENENKAMLDYIGTA